jgi:threonine dehydrogenase-like Zn-dependent dehydrogenase
MRGSVVVLVAPRQTELRQYDVADPGAGEALLEITRANVCGSELHIWRGHHPTVKMGSVLGHEMLGPGAGPGETTFGFSARGRVTTLACPTIGTRTLPRLDRTRHGYPTLP